jgi:hypothetical protein
MKHDDRIASTDDERYAAAWAASGAMALTGYADGPLLGPPSRLVPGLAHAAAVIDAKSAELGTRVKLDALALLGERAALTYLYRGGRESCGRMARLLRARDGWFAVSFARYEDEKLVPAWLETSMPRTLNPWPHVTEVTATRPVDELVERGAMLGLPIARLPEALPPQRPLDALPVNRVEAMRIPAAPRPLSELTVVDLSSLWAGPLCGSILAAAGAQVIKVESMQRPDGARRGSVAFFNRLNAGKGSMTVDLDSAAGRYRLHAMIACADVVIEASRPRALEQLGINATEILTTESPRVWASITGYGRGGEDRNRVAFGDDAAVAGGLVSWTDDMPVFTADAVADPASGVVAAAAILDALSTSRHWLLDVAMADVAAHLAGPTLPAAPGPVAPRARRARGRAPRLGEHDPRFGDGPYGE